MPTLRQILASHAPLLVLDAASSTVQVGWVRSETESDWRSSEDEAGVGVFRCVEDLGVTVAQAGAFVFCEGPGSVLGIRTSAMAVRTWRLLHARPVFAYGSLALVAQAHARPDTAVIADARRESWHHYQIGRGLRRVPAGELASEAAALVMPAGFRHWSPLPANATEVPYSVRELLSRAAEADLFHEAPAPDAFLHEEPSYVTWTPEIHRAPAVAPGTGRPEKRGT